MENSFRKASAPVNSELFHIIMIPPYAPIEGKNSNLLNLFWEELFDILQIK
jgi:hypothetical protein